MARLILGIDQGTTGTRACVMDESGQVRAQAYRAHAQHCDRPGWVEHDPEEIWAATEEVVERVWQGGIQGIGLANQGETVMLWDRSTGRPLGRAIVWQDVRTQSYVDELAHDAQLAGSVAARTGLRLDAYFSASKIRWLLDHLPDARARAKAGELCVGTLDAWLIFKLTGGRVFATDPSTAARTLLYDIHQHRYDDFLLDLFEVPRASLPEVRPSVGRFGATRDVPIVASAVDQPAALYGHGCVNPGQLKATYGTGCFVYLNTGTATPSHDGLLTTIAWQIDGRTTYALDGGIFAAGSLVNWLRDKLGLFAADSDLDALAARESDGVVCVPALAGLGAPHFDRHARAAFVGLGLASGREQLVRAALEGIALRVVQVVRAMEQAAGLRVNALRVDGGLTRSRVLMQAQADLLGVPVEVAAESEATSVGVCRMAAHGLGWRTEWPNAVAHTFEPRACARAEMLERFDRAVTWVRSW